MPFNPPAARPERLIATFHEGLPLGRLEALGKLLEEIVGEKLYLRSESATPPGIQVFSKGEPLAPEEPVLGSFPRMPRG